MLAFIACCGSGLVAPPRRAPLRVAVARAVAESECATLATGLDGVSAVEGLFMGPDGEPVRFLRREKFVAAVAAQCGCAPDTALELWLTLGGAPPPPPVEKRPPYAAPKYGRNKRHLSRE